MAHSDITITLYGVQLPDIEANFTNKHYEQIT